MIELGSCGRPRKNGEPCRNRLQSGQLACPLHATQIEKALAEGHWSWYREGYREGEDAGRSAERSGIDDERRTREERDLHRQGARGRSRGPGDEPTGATKALSESYDARWHQGFGDGFEGGRAAERRQIEYESRREEREKEEAARFRERDVRGQLVVVDRGKALTYRWTGDGDLRAGDLVLVPGNWLDPQARTCQVTAIGSSYEGEIHDIIRRVAD